jgi:hypothetical protein
MQEPKLAIVATVRNPGSSFRTWIAYHLHQVDRVFIFLDKPGTGDEQLIPSNPRVTVLAGAQPSSSMTGQNGVMQRQTANVGRAVDLCLKDGITWLLHIDADELIWSAQTRIKSYFASVEPDVSQVSFVNHEALNQFCAEEDYFREMRLFKRNGHEFPPDLWIHARRHGFFTLYGNGKSAARVDKAIGVDGVHLFRVSAGRTRYESGTCILHYPCATYAEWLKKPSFLGDLLPYWWDNPQTPIEFPFLLDSRDAYLESVRTGNWEIAKGFYMKSLFTDGEVANLLELGAVFRADPLERIALENA